MTPEDAELIERLKRDAKAWAGSVGPTPRLEREAACALERLAAERDEWECKAGQYMDERDRAEAEVAVLRRVVRAADFFVQPGQDSRYDEARAALVEFDRDAQEATNERI